MKKITLLTALTVAALSSVSFATTIIQVKDFDFVPTDSRSLTFDQFNTALGTLEAINVSFTLNKIGGNLQADNDSTQSGTITLTHKVQSALTSTDVYLDNASGHGQVGSSLVATSSTSSAIGATSSDSIAQFDSQPGHVDYVTFSPANKTVSTSGDIAEGSWGADLGNDVVGYLGSATFSILMSADQITTISGVGGIAQAFVPSRVTGNVTVTYSYTPTAVPEPTTWAMLVGGLGVLFAGRRLTRRS